MLTIIQPHPVVEVTGGQVTGRARATALQCEIPDHGLQQPAVRITADTERIRTVAACTDAVGTRCLERAEIACQEMPEISGRLAQLPGEDNLLTFEFDYLKLSGPRVIGDDASLVGVRHKPDLIYVNVHLEIARKRLCREARAGESEPDEQQTQPAGNAVHIDPRSLRLCDAGPGGSRTRSDSDARSEVNLD